MRLLDLYCGAGGAAKGYHVAGFDEIDGVDNKPQPHYPYNFIQADALEYLAEHGRQYDAVHASPPCQAYSIMHNLPWLRGREYPLLILPTMEMLEGLGKPYVLENVMGARAGSRGLRKRGLEHHGLRAGWLCGAMFGLPFYRHRLFAANWLWLAPMHPKHRRLGLETPLGNSPIKNGRHGFDTHVQRGKAPTAPGDNRGLEAWPGRREHPAGLTVANGTLNTWGPGSGLGKQAGWKLAAAAMGIDWMNRDELTQAIPPAYTEHIGAQLIAAIMERRPHAHEPHTAQVEQL